MTGYKIVFMGTPEFAVPTLKELFKENEKVVAVVAQPNRPRGRGRKTVAPPVKIEAERHGCLVLQPEKASREEFVEQIRELSPDLFVVVAYGHILSKKILSIPRIGAINIHASLLPKYRGAAPIQWAIINGEKETGVTTMWMDVGMDTGDMLISSRVTIEPDDTAATLHDRLSVIGAQLLIKTINRLKNGDLKSALQNPDHATYAPMLKKEAGRIDWAKSAAELDCFVRGMSPWPGAFTTISGKTLKIFKVKVVSGHAEAPPGAIIPSFPGELYVATGKEILSLMEVQAPAGKRLKIQDFLRGHAITPGTIMGKNEE
ncbi:MAG: methionyl-tRNA formyltransferase [Deltaproteobacteria bacterium]|nr:methionyl-tRNA formyltransferase [Deltaproteobacteria bacterium]